MSDRHLEQAPYGYDVYTHTEVVPKLAPPKVRWVVGPVRTKDPRWVPNAMRRIAKIPSPNESEITVQLTADQQVQLSVAGTDKYGNPVEITGDSVWESSDESIIQVEVGATVDVATATAVGPAGTASVTFTNDVNRDGTGDFMGSLAIDVVAGEIAEIAVTAGAPEDKP